MGAYEKTKRKITDLVGDLILVLLRAKPKTADYEEKRQSISAYLDRLIIEVREEERKKMRQEIRSELMMEEAEQIIESAIERSIADSLKPSDLKNALEKILPSTIIGHLSDKKVENVVQKRLEDSINIIKSRKEFEFLLPSDPDKIKILYKRLSEELRKNMPIYLVTNKCRELLENLPEFDEVRWKLADLDELEEMQEKTREALNELRKWKLDNFVNASALEEAMSFQGKRICRELDEAGFPRFSRKLSNREELICYYIPVEPSFSSEVEKVEEQLEEKIRNMGKIISELRKAEARKKAEQIRIMRAY